MKIKEILKRYVGSIRLVGSTFEENKLIEARSYGVSDIQAHDLLDLVETKLVNNYSVKQVAVIRDILYIVVLKDEDL